MMITWWMKLGGNQQPGRTKQQNIEFNELALRKVGLVGRPLGPSNHNQTTPEHTHRMLLSRQTKWCHSDKIIQAFLQIISNVGNC